MSEYEDRNEQREGLSLAPLLNILGGYWYLFLLSIMFALGIAFLVNRYTKAIYNLRTTVIIKDERNQSTGNEMLLDEVNYPLFMNRKLIANEVEILRSRSLIQEVLTNLDFRVTYIGVGNITENELYKQSPFKAQVKVLDSGVYKATFLVDFIDSSHYTLRYEDKKDQFSGDFRTGEKVNYKKFELVLTRVDSLFETLNLSNLDQRQYKFHVNSTEQLIQEYSAKVQIKPIKETSILDMNIQEANVAKGNDFLNTLTATYINKGVEAKNIIATNTLAFIKDQLEVISGDLGDVEVDIEKYKRESGLLDLEVENSETVKRLLDLDEQRTKTLVQLKSIDYLNTYLQSNNDISELTPATFAVVDPLLVPSVSTLKELHQKRNDLLLEGSRDNPLVVQLDKRIEIARKDLLELVQNIRKTTNISLQSLDKQIRQFEGVVSRLPQTERELVALRRKFSLNEKIYLYLLEKSAEVGITKAATVADNRVLDPAHMTGQVKPQKTRNLLAGFFIGLLLPAIGLYIKFLLDDKIRNRDHLSRHTEVPLLGMVGHEETESQVVVHKNSKSPIAEAFRSLRTNLQYLATDQDKKIILLTSTVGGEGKTFCSLNLAAAIALSDKKVVLLCMDLRKKSIFYNQPSFHNTGISNYLIGKAMTSDIIQPSEYPNLDVIVSGPLPPNPSELLLSDRLPLLFDELRATYDYVIVDTPPVGLVTDALIVMKHTDINIYVLRENYSRIPFLRNINELYEEKSFNNLALLLNDVRMNNGRYGYRYGYGYGYGYTYGYGYFDEKKNRSLGQRLKRIFAPK